MPSGKKARQQRREAATAPAKTPPPVRSKGAGGVRARQASPRVLAIAGGVVIVVVIAIVLGVVLSGGNKKTLPAANFPASGSHTWVGALPGAAEIYNLYKGIPQNGLELGAPNAPATLTEFIDLQCPLCQQFETQQMPTIVRKYVRIGKLKIKLEPWSILDRPGSPPDSNRGQAATIAASLQDKGFQFAEMLYLNQGQEDSGWLTDNMIGYAASSVDGLSPQRIFDERNSSGVKGIVSDVDAAASAHGFNGTPTILLNHAGKPPRVVSVGVPTFTTLESQIQTAIGG